MFDDYETVKNQFHGTADACKAQGFAFTPMVMESHSGACSLQMRRVIDFIAQRQASMTSKSDELASLRIAQRISISLQRENARAVLRRRVPGIAQNVASDWGQWGDETQDD